MKKKITWKKTKRKTIEENVAYRIACNLVRARLAVDSPTIEKQAQRVAN
jgi:hypothetical protein